MAQTCNPRNLRQQKVRGQPETQILCTSDWAIERELVQKEKKKTNKKHPANKQKNLQKIPLQELRQLK